MGERRWGFQNVVKKIFGTKDGAYKGNKKTDHDICEEPAKKAKYENSYKQVFPIGTGICGCHYPPEAVFHEELKGPYYQRFGQGSKGGFDEGCASVRNTQNKQGCNSTTAGPSQDVKRNACRISIGNGPGQSSEVPQGGGTFTDTFGKSADFGSDTGTSGSSANKGVYTTGTFTMNAEKGVAMGVNKGNNKNVWTRWEPDGTFHLQVKPDGNSGGEAFVKISPNGEVTIETRGTCNIKAQNINLEANRMKVDIPSTKWTGNIKQDGIHRDERGLHLK